MNKKNFDKHFNGLLMGFANHPVMQKLLKEGAVSENLSKHIAVLEYSAEKVLKWVNDNCKQGADVDKIFDNCSTLLDKCQNAIGDVANDINTIKGNNPKLAEELNGFYGEVKNFASSFNDYKNKFKDALKEYVKAPQIDEDDPVIEYFPDKEFSKYFLAANQNEEIQVFPNEPNKNDIVQTNNNACYFLAGLHSLAENHPDAVKNLIRDNGDGTVTVKFYPFAGSGKHTGTGKKKEMLVTIDKTLPSVDSHSANWVRLLEKALAASKLVAAGGYEPDKSELHKKTTIDYLDGGQPNLTMSLLDPSFSGSPYDRNYVSDQMKSLKDVGEAFEAFGQKLINAKKNGSVIALCDDMHVVDVTDIVTDNRGNYTLTYYDQMRQQSESLSLRRDVFTGGLYKSIMIYDFASQKDSHEATNIIFGDILKEVRAHKKDKNYVVPEETKQWQKDLAAGKGEPPLIPLSQEEVDRYENFNQIRDLDPEQRKVLVPEGLPQLFVPDYKKGIKEEIKEEPKQEIKKEAKPEVKPVVEQPKPVVEQPKPEIKEEPKHEIRKNKEPKKLNFTNQFIAKTVEKITVKDNQRIKSEGVDYGGVPIEIQMTNDIMYMNNWYDRNKEKLSPEADSYFQAHYESARYFEKLSLSRKSNKKTPTDMNVGFYDPDEKGVSEFEKGEYCIPNLGKQRNQTSDSGCWSCAYENLLRSRGVDIPQEMIRSFRSNDTMSHLDLEGYKTDSREKDGRGINGKRDVALQYITDTSESIMTRADLMLKVLPNTAMRTKEFTFPTEELLKSSGVTEDTIDEKLLGNKMLETVRDAIGLSRSPVAVYFGGHYRTISAVNIEKRTIRWVDSMDQDPNAEREIKIDDLITHCRTARPDASIAFTWMEDLVPDEKGNCSINGFEDYKYQDKKLYNNNSDLNSSDDYVKNGILATKSIDDNNLMIIETVCLPEDLITLSAYQQQIPPEIEVSGKPHVYAEDPYPLPTNKRILVQKPSVAPDKIDDLKKEDLEKNPKIYDDPQEIMFRENVNLVLNSWDEKEKYFPNIVDSDDLKNRIKIEKSNRTEVLNSFIGAINKMNNELTQKGEEPLKFPDWKKNDRLFRRLGIMQNNHYKLQEKLIDNEHIYSSYAFAINSVLPDKDHILSVEQLEAKAEPVSQEQIKQQANVIANSQSLVDDMLKQQLGDAYNPEEMKAVHNQMEAKFMKDEIYETLAKEGIIKNVLGYGLGTRLATYNHLINIRKDENEFKNHLLDIGYAMEALKPETMQRLFEQGKIKKEQLDYYNNNRKEFNGDAAVEYVQEEFYKKANSLAEQLNEPVPFSPEPKQEVKPVVEQAKQENNLPRDFQLFMYEAGRIGERTVKTHVETPEGGDYWAPVKKVLAPLKQRLSKIANEDNLQKIDVDSLYDLYRNVIDALDNAIKKAPPTEALKKCELFVKEAYSKEELKASADAYIADFKNPIDIEKYVKPKNPLNYSDDPLQKKMQQAALKLSFWSRVKFFYTNDGSAEELDKKYDQCARAIENGTDENMLILNRIDKSKVGNICDMVLSKGSISSLIDFNVYMPDENSLGKVQPIIQQAFETFFNPKAQEGPNKFYNTPLKDSDPIVKDANRKIQLMDITVPEGLDDNDVALLTAAELMSDRIIGPTFKKALKYGGWQSTIPKDADLVSGGRDAFANSLLGGDERPNMQYMRYGVVEARLSAARILEEYKSGNKQAMADSLLSSLIENAKHQKMFMTVDNTVGAFYTKCISDTIKLLDSEKFEGLVEIPQEVRDIDKINRAHLKMAEEAAELKVQLNDYCIEKILNGNTQNPKDDPEFVNLYSKWYARTSHLNMEEKTNQRKRAFNAVMKKGVETDKNRELTGIEKKLAENADEYIRLSEEFFLDSDAKKKLFEKDYTSWRGVLSTGIKITSNAEVVPVTLDLEDKEFSSALRFAIESLDDNNYPGIKEKLLSRPPLDGAKLPRNASKAEVEFRLKQYDDYLDYFDSLNLQDVPSPITKEKGREHYLRDDLAFPINNFKKKVEGIKNTLADARKFEKAIGVFEKESSELYDLHTKKQIGLFTDEIVRLAARVAKTDNDKYKNSMSYKGLQFTISDCASKKSEIKTENELKGIVKFLNQSADDYLEDHANEKMGFFKTCGKARQERIKTCARIKTMKELLDKGIAYDSPEGKKRMLACKLVCAEKLDKGFPGFKELCQPDAIKNAIDEKLNDPVFKIVANRALEKEADYDKLVKMSGSNCLKTFNKAKAAIEKANAQEKEQEKEQELGPQI